MSIFDTILLCLFFILLLMPLFSEISILGFSVKKEIKTIKEDIQKLSISMNVQQSLSNIINIDLSLPSKNDIKNYPKPSSTELEKIEYNISEDELFIARTRMSIEKEIRRLAIENSYQRLQAPLRGIIEFLNYTVPEFRYLYAEIMDIIAICNRVIHGEKVENQYTEFVKAHSADIIKKLQEIKAK